MRLQEWWDSGQRLPLRVGSGVHRIFHRVDGEGPWTTFLHGFPTSSWDWAHVARRLPAGRRRLYVDHLGFGASDKPHPHRYTFAEQIELLAALWAHHGVQATDLVAHDYSVSIAQEILARSNRGEWDGPRIRSLVLLNGGLFYRLQKPRPIQRALRVPRVGDLVAKAVREGGFRRAMERIVVQPWPSGDLGGHWEALQRAGGRRAVPALSAYHRERRESERRWGYALGYCSVPLRLLWGLGDPVSGAPMLEGLARYDVRTARVVGWDDVGHYPHAEVPARVAAEVAAVEARTAAGPGRPD